MPDNRSKNWLKIGCIGFVALLCLLGLGTFGYLKYRVGQKASRLPELLAKLKAKGIATEPVDFYQGAAVDKDKNAASLYSQIATKIEEIRKTNEPSAVGEALGNLTFKRYLDDDVLIAQGLKNRKEIFQLAEEAAKRPNCNFGYDLSEASSVTFPQLSYMKNTARWLAVRAKAQANAGDFDGALSSIRTAFAIVNHLSQQPMLIGALVAFAANVNAIVGLEQVTIIGRNNPAYLAKARALLESLPPLPDLKLAFSGEMVLGRYSIEKLRSWKEFESAYSGDYVNGPTTPTPIDNLTLGDPEVRKMYEAQYVELWSEVFDKFPANPDDWKPLVDTMQAINDRISKDDSMENKINRILFPLFGETAKSRATALALRRVALTSIRLLQDRATKGLPKDLSGYGPSAIDPMDGKPLRIRVLNKGFKVWSIDRDLVDDGGLKYIPNTGMNLEKKDLVWGFDYPFPSPPAPKGYGAEVFKPHGGGGPPLMTRPPTLD